MLSVIAYGAEHQRFFSAVCRVANVGKGAGGQILAIHSLGLFASTRVARAEVIVELQRSALLMLSNTRHCDKRNDRFPSLRFEK